MGDPSWLMTRRGLAPEALRSELDEINQISAREYLKYTFCVKVFRMISMISIIVFIHGFWIVDGWMRLTFLCALIMNVIANICASVCVKPMEFAAHHALTVVCKHMNDVLIVEYEPRMIEWGIIERETFHRFSTRMDITIKCADDTMMIEHLSCEMKTNSPTFRDEDEVGDNNRTFVIQIDDLDPRDYNGPQVQRFPSDAHPDVRSHHFEVNASMFGVASPRANLPER